MKHIATNVATNSSGVKPFAICDGLSEQEIKRHGLEVYLHKERAFVLVKGIGTFGVASDGGIKHCPYCGVEIEKEERS